MQARRRVLRALATVATVAAAVAVGVVVSPGGGRTVQAVGDGGGEFHAIEPARILDTREPGPFSGRITIGQEGSAPEFRLPVVGEGGLPDFASNDGDRFDDDVLAVVLTVTVVDPNRKGYVRVFGTGTVEGETSVVNYRPGERVPNSAIIRPGRDGQVSFRFVTAESSGSVDLLVDVSGWFSTSQYPESGARTFPVEPTRIFDSREPEFGSKPFGTGTQVELPIHGATQYDDPSNEVVPDSPDVVGVVLNLTGVNDRSGSKQTFVSVLPNRVPAGTVPETSNLNLAAGQRRANLVIVPVPADGTLTLFNRAGSLDLVVDVVGYLRDGVDAATDTGRVVPLVSPFRAFDTREAEHYAQPLGPASAEDWSFDAFVNDVKIGTSPVGPQSGMFANLTATGLERQYPWAPVQTYVSAYPSPASAPGMPPNASNLNLREGMSVPNLSLLRYGSSDSGDYELAFYNRAGRVHYLLDVYAVILE